MLRVRLNPRSFERSVRQLVTACACASIAFAWVLPAAAQPKPGYDPTSTHIFPAGGRRGTVVPVRVGTECAPPGTRFLIDGRGVTAPPRLGKPMFDVGEPSPRRAPTETPITYPRQWRSTISLAADSPLGVVHWRLGSAQGGTASRPFVIGDLPEHIERESNSTRGRAERIQPPVTLNGQIHGERDRDYYRFDAAAGQLFVFETLARRLGSPLDPLIAIVDDQGNELAVDTVHIGDDPVLVFRAPRAGPFVLRVANVSLHGSPACVYRVNVTCDQPLAAYVFPSAGQRGTTQDVEIVARIGDGNLKTFHRTVAMLSEQATLSWREPTLAGSLALAVDNAPQQIETEPNHDRAAANSVQIPRTVHGRFGRLRDEDWYAFEADKSARYEFTCAAPHRGACLPTLRLTDADGKPIQTVRSVETTDGVCRIDWTAPQPGRYLLRVRELRYASRFGGEMIYRLSLRRARPDFELRVASDAANLTQGGQLELAVDVVRRGGFDGPIRIEADDLPAGVTLANDEIAAKKSSAKLQLKAEDATRVHTAPIRLVGVATIDGSNVRRTVMAAHLGADSEGVGVGPRRLDRLFLTIKHKPIFRLYCSEAYQYAHRGTVYPYGMEIERLNGFKGAVMVEQGDRQNRDLDGIQMRSAIVPAGDTEFDLPIYLPETMHINIQSQSQLYSQAFARFTDQHGQQLSVLVLAEKRNMLRTLPPVVKLTAATKTVSVTRGGQVRCGLQLERTSNFPGAMRVELIDAPPGITADPAEFPAAAVSLDVAVQAASEVDSRMKEIPLRFRASGPLPNGHLAISECTLTLRVRSP